MPRTLMSNIIHILITVRVLVRRLINESYSGFGPFSTPSTGSRNLLRRELPDLNTPFLIWIPIFLIQNFIDQNVIDSALHDKINANPGFDRVPAHLGTILRFISRVILEAI
ncbi:hypothetical protein [Methanosarcina acetivorans]|uniref:hypothetical protein n=1 Tax=Methanosarcina acetivorans TaxID=2214 RepID=UPI0012FF4153|nr:hypothetical protein [Methanosarcina acetivorans]